MLNCEPSSAIPTTGPSLKKMGGLRKFGDGVLQLSQKSCPSSSGQQHSRFLQSMYFVITGVSTCTVGRGANGAPLVGSSRFFLPHHFRRTSCRIYRTYAHTKCMSSGHIRDRDRLSCRLWLEFRIFRRENQFLPFGLPRSSSSKTKD